MKSSRLEAIEKGEKRYEGSECKKCGNTTRYTLNSNCVFCTSEAAKEHTRKTRKKIKEILQKMKGSAA
jgi:hypothetical protein